MKIPMVSFCIAFWFPYQIVYIVVMPTIINIMSLSEDQSVSELWALPAGLTETGKEEKALKVK